MTIDIKSISTRDLHQFLLASVAPRPIALVSTIDDNGNPNLAPYSFFNVFSSNPPIAVFSSNRRVVDNTTKDTLHNIYQNKEAVINVVNYAIVRQMAVSSIQYDKDVSEFKKSGLTPIESEMVRPFRVKESPASMECKVREVIALGEHGGAGHLIVCDIVRLHICDEVIDENNRIDPHKIDLVGRMGRAHYCRASGDAIFNIIQPVTRIAIGFDQLPEDVRNSKVLSGNDLGRLAGLPNLPTKKELASMVVDEKLQKILLQVDSKELVHAYAQELITEDNLEKALKILLFKSI